MKPQRFEFDMIHLDRSDGRPQFRQLEDQLRNAINSGLLPQGARLPSSRRLSKLVSVSRNTVVVAYEQLVSEGYLETRQGSGTAVCKQRFDSRLAAKPFLENARIEVSRESLSSSGKRLSRYAEWLKRSDSPPVAFRPHIPALDKFPNRVWNQISADQARRYSTTNLNSNEPQGYKPLRKAIAEYMGTARGVACNAQQVVITSSAQQGFQLIAQLLLDTGDKVWMEEPGNIPACEPFIQAGAVVTPVDVDDEGIRIEEGIRLAPDRKMICVTPGAQWPTAKTMSLARRLALMEEARRKQCWIIEDDYNGEFRYCGRPHPPLCSLDNSGRTIYMGTFSKMLFPSVRLSFLIVPEVLAGDFAAARWVADRSSPHLNQMALYRFIDEGHFARHIRTMRMLYTERQAYLYEGLLDTFGDDAVLEKPEVGMHLLLKGKTPSVEADFMEAADRAGIEYHQAAAYASDPRKGSGLILGFAAYDQEKPDKALSVWKKSMSLSPRVFPFRSLFLKLE